MTVCVLEIRQRFDQIIQHAQVALYRLKPGIITHIIIIIVEENQNTNKPPENYFS